MRTLLDHSDFGTVPLAIAAMLALWPGGGLMAQALQMAAGAVAWTFLEYWAHRAMHMHWFPRLRALHVRHHARPADASGGTLYSSAIILALIGSALVVPILAPALTGLLTGYLFFIALHYAEHHAPHRLTGGVLGRLADAHDLHHHAGPARMFGVSTQVWDRLFGTA